MSFLFSLGREWECDATLSFLSPLSLPSSSRPIFQALKHCWFTYWIPVYGVSAQLGLEMRRWLILKWSLLLPYPAKLCLCYEYSDEADVIVQLLLAMVVAGAAGGKEPGSQQAGVEFLLSAFPYLLAQRYMQMSLLFFIKLQMTCKGITTWFARTASTERYGCL